ncbi:MAG: NADH-quinone oxidoreductase subunit C [Dehalococcoidia bacterium]|nr:MAG: NADH-quinone oxidoreductase subunit C [Dehalococcoidia bacterium]UCG83603.1 MAG: NADH-quinone oxidoreductase subunit C [Dehalococcoidia bacterium]
MTKPLIGSEVAEKIWAQLPEAVIEYDESVVYIENDSVLDVCRFLNQTSGLDFDYLLDLTAVDYLDYLEVVYRLFSIKHNHSLVLKTRCFNREQPTLPSVTVIWNGANLMEREVYDLLGIHFSGHPNMKRIFLWEGFEGHPLRRDFL